MKTLIILLCLSAALVAKASDIPLDYRDAVVKAIYVSEGGVKTRYPYGIMSVKTDNPKRVCENTVANNWKRWEKAGRPGTYLDFLSRRYCPGDDRTTWLKNVSFYTKKNYDGKLQPE